MVRAALRPSDGSRPPDPVRGTQPRQQGRRRGDDDPSRAGAEPVEGPATRGGHVEVRSEPAIRIDFMRREGHDAVAQLMGRQPQPARRARNGRRRPFARHPRLWARSRQPRPRSPRPQRQTPWPRGETRQRPWTAKTCLGDRDLRRARRVSEVPVTGGQHTPCRSQTSEVRKGGAATPTILSPEPLGAGADCPGHPTSTSQAR